MSFGCCWRALALAALLMAAAPRAGAADAAAPAPAEAASPELRACLRAIPRSPLARTGTTQAVFPGDAGYDWARA